MYGDPTDPEPQDRQQGADMPFYSRDWQFDPYHQRLSFAQRRDPGQVDADTEWRVWEVFQQERRGEHHRHVGSVHASDGEMALILAKESFARRGHCVNLWVALAQEVYATEYDDADVFEHTTDKSYREPGGYHGLRKSKIHGRPSSGADAPAEGEGDD